MEKLEICSKCRFEKESVSGCQCSRCLTISEHDGFVPKTNADRIRSMSDEELAEYISELVRNAHEYLTGEGDWLQWLKSEAKE